jgi:hypothetical protein
MDSKLNNISNGWSEKTNGTLFALVSVIATVDSLDTVYCVLREPNVKQNPSSPNVAQQGLGVILKATSSEGGEGKNAHETKNARRCDRHRGSG